MSNLSTIQKTTRAAVAALIIGAASISAVPAQAGNNVSFGFSFNSGNGVGFSIGSNNHRQRQHVGHRRQQRQCMTNWQVRQGLRGYGFNHIRIMKTHRAKVWVRAVRGRWEYKMIVNRCDGQVNRMKKVRRHHHRGHNQGHNQGHRNQHGGNGLQLQFNFR